MDYSIRVKVAPPQILLLETKAVGRKVLSPINDFYYKPKEKTLQEFDPSVICIRLREFPKDNKAILDKLEFQKTETGYTNSKETIAEGTRKELEQKAEEQGYEKWGEVKFKTIEFTLGIDGTNVVALLQKIQPVGTFLKIESDSEDGLNKIIELLSIKDGQKVDKNSAVLLAENRGFL